MAHLYNNTRIKSIAAYSLSLACSVCVPRQQQQHILICICMRAGLGREPAFIPAAASQHCGSTGAGRKKRKKKKKRNIQE